MAGYLKRWLCCLFGLVLVPGCSDNLVEVSGPFYLGSFEAGGQPWLFRCPDGPPGCANDTLPDGRVLRAGGNAEFIAFEMENGFFYFRRVAEERRGWGNNPEVIIGPLDAANFAADARDLGLPALDVEW